MTASTATRIPVSTPAVPPPSTPSPLLSLAMVVGPAVAYVPQYRTMAQARSADGFSLWTCGILLWSNLLRVFFWLGKRFDTVLLAQSLVMIVAQLLLLELTVRLRPRTTQSSSSSSSLKRNLNPWLALQNERARSELLRSRTTDFWQWADVHVYVLALGGMCAVMSVGQLLFGGLSMWVEMVGAVALMLEAGLGVPQAWRNYERRSVRGLSLSLIASWALGDAFKTYYFLSSDAPMQFIMCGLVQLIVDAVIVVQLWVYREVA